MSGDWIAWCHEVECVANGLGLHDAGAADQWCTAFGRKITERLIDREDEAYAAGRLAGFEEGLDAVPALDLTRLAEAVAFAHGRSYIDMLDTLAAEKIKSVYEAGMAEPGASASRAS